MPVVISDEILKQAGMTEREAVLEIACWLFDSGKLALWPAAKMAGMGRSEFEAELGRRKIAVYRPTPEDFAEDLATLERLRDRL
jgi:predicted HTH domain antitoxin